MLDNVGFNNKCGIDGKHIIDNSCGNGNFLVEIVKRIFQFIPNIDREYLETYVHGIEIDELAYNEAINRLNKIATEHNISNVKWDVRNSDALRTTDFDNSMDYVVGNPPYCNVHHMSKENYDLLKTEFFFCSDGMTDLYIGFFEKGIQMLNSNGILGYITPNSWLTSKAGYWLRDHLYSHNSLQKIYNFDTDKLFNDATTFTCITIIDNNRSFDDDNIVVYHGNFNDLSDNKRHCSVVDKHDIYVDEKILTNLKDDVIRHIIDYEIKDYDKRFIVKNGLATLKDKLFVINPNDKDTNVDIYVELYCNEIIDCVKASKGEFKYIIYPYDDSGKPLSYDNLCLYVRNLLERRAERLDIDMTQENWYLYGRTQAIKDVNKYRVSCNNLIRDKNDVILRELPANTAVYSGFYIIRNGMLQNRKEMKLLYHQVEDALKTNLFANYVKSIGKSKNGGYYTFSTEDLEQFLNYFYSI
jgi:adenine-specific DNA-methyltransferase